ncbi:hypothetical protein L6R21_21925 [bacterium]|nr:hypothetical protein [bacterium]
MQNSIIIKDPENKVKDDGSKVEVVVEVKNWTGFENWEEEKQLARLTFLRNQLLKYKASGKPVQLDWKGNVPEKVRRAVERIGGVKINPIA